MCVCVYVCVYREEASELPFLPSLDADGDGFESVDGEQFVSFPRDIAGIG
jgi:hypothetical protein